MNIVNISDPAWRRDDEPEGYGGPYFQLGPVVGAKRTGMSVYELGPGQSICPYHYECAEEEWLLVMEGNPTLRHPDGESQLSPSDVVFFPVGPAGAHKLTNATDDVVRLIMFSDVVTPSATVYPDSDKIGIWPGEGTEKLIVRRASGVGYWDGEG